MSPQNLLGSIVVGAVAGALSAVFVIKSMVPGAIPITAPGSSELSVAPAAASYDTQVISVVKEASPAVVSIIVSKDVPVVERYFENVPSPFEDFFGSSRFNFQVPRYRQNGTEKQEIGGGSGFL